ncbi:MAG: helix-turn-helix domain-containing protein [Spirochaetaceae bacterium]|jgi:transcriptional regulator with XRE-family HTH domain|nr:helix-turn-helix domain-containing protein [Spirochaetaceae bacterium]
MTNIKKLLGTNIRNYRLEKGWTQEKLAEAAQTATNYLGLIECGKKFPSAGMIERIASALGRDAVELFTLAPLRMDWQREILTDIEKLIEQRIDCIDLPEGWKITS